MVDGEPALKSERKKCYEARDKFISCLDKLSEAGKSPEQAEYACRAERKQFDKSCPASWVAHFIRKHNFEKYKEALAKQGVNIVDKNELEGSSPN